jgi:hypothetical protein
VVALDDLDIDDLVLLADDAWTRNGIPSLADAAKPRRQRHPTGASS